MRALVVGSSSYVAGGLVQELLATGADVTLVNRDQKQGSAASPGLRTFSADYSTLSGFREALDGQDVVYYCSGLNRNAASVAPDLAQYISSEVPRKLAELADANGTLRFVYLSTVHVYGQAVSGKTDETSPTNPADAYARSRLSGETALLDSSFKGLKVKVARLGNVFGWSPNMNESTSSLIGNDLCRQASTTSEVIIRANPNISRNFVPMRQVSIDLCRLGNSEEAHEDLYNLVWGSSQTLSDFGVRVKKQSWEALHKEIQVSFTQARSDVTKLEYSDVRIRQISNRIPELFDSEIRSLLLKFSEGPA